MLFAANGKNPSDTSKTNLPNKKFELSFGNSVLFISADKQDTIYQRGGLVVPTSALLFLSEFRPSKKLRIPAFVNLPTESKQFLVDGQLVNEKANITFGSGFEYKIGQIKISDDARMEFEAGPLASCIVGRGWKFRLAPVIAGRMRIVKSQNFVMYFGSSYSFGINAIGILYGTGYLF